ncbi:hypothetical protein MKEN_00995700 [Mycena kentingensis (nom. inval.)]|nr:hypothetical protein MKEN_00995700 [Mycena kentingensis (nom. inval.)]
MGPASILQTVRGMLRSNDGSQSLGIIIEATDESLSGTVKALGRQALDGVPTLLRTLETLARVHPFVELAFIPFKLLYHLEIKRRDNDHRRTTLFAVIKDAMLALVELEYFTEDYTAHRTTPTGQKIKSRIMAICETMQQDIRGCYEELQIHDRSAPAMHFVRAAGRNKVLAEYGARFKSAREDLVFALQIENAVAVNKMRHMLEEQLTPRTPPAVPDAIAFNAGPAQDSYFPVPRPAAELLPAEDDYNLFRVASDPTTEHASQPFELDTEIELLMAQPATSSCQTILGLRDQLLGQSRWLKFHNDVGRDRPPGRPHILTPCPSWASTAASFPLPSPPSSPAPPPYPFAGPRGYSYEGVDLLYNPRTPPPPPSPPMPAPMYWDFQLEAGGYFGQAPRARSGMVASWGDSPDGTVVGEGSPFIVGLDVGGSEQYEDVMYRPNMPRGWSFGAVSRELEQMDSRRRMNTSRSSTRTATTELGSDSEDGTVVGESDSDSESGAIYMRPLRS